MRRGTDGRGGAAVARGWVSGSAPEAPIFFARILYLCIESIARCRVSHKEGKSTNPLRMAFFTMFSATRAQGHQVWHGSCNDPVRASGSPGAQPDPVAQSVERVFSVFAQLAHPSGSRAERRRLSTLDREVAGSSPAWATLLCCLLFEPPTVGSHWFCPFDSGSPTITSSPEQPPSLLVDPPAPGQGHAGPPALQGLCFTRFGH